jgi:general secretion pathway protein D
LIGIALKGKNFASTLKFLETFGKTRTLSSPRLTVLNNQPAIFKVAENRVYFRLRYERLERSKDMGGDLVSTSSDIHTMPLGLILSVQPSINLDDETITLALRPTITSSIRAEADPAVSIASNQQVKSEVPIVEVRELDSILHLKSGQAIVLGGLMQERSRERTSGLPGTSRAPILKTLLGADSGAHEVVELVIFLRAHILDPDDGEPEDDIDPTLPQPTDSTPRL